ncbi:hypothetical protein EZV62_028161 [Acer yangbiense]|uniref:DUF4283 domain-containing protein n=1 Tax=Acer yangbiense TaxID=1000413 RepID=A0A5C7GP43_9ROSI|nr:hypothetical protein EZV62_028161 [Acer yangbiense]
MGFRLVGKVLTNKLVNRETFIGLFPRIWHTVEEFEIEAITGNIFSFTFRTAKDRWQVLQGGPWTFDKALLVLEEPQGKGDIQKMNFDKVAFWVQIHNVSLICMTADIGRFLGGMVGRLKRLISISLGTVWGSIYGYGLLRHVVRDCLETKIGNGPEDFDQLFGLWLRAESPIRVSNPRPRRDGFHVDDDRRHKETGGDFMGLVGNKDVRFQEACSMSEKLDYLLVGREKLESIPNVVDSKCLAIKVTGSIDAIPDKLHSNGGEEVSVGVELTQLKEKGTHGESRGMDFEDEPTQNFVEMEVEVIPHVPVKMNAVIKEKLDTSQQVPKIGKWKRWARDGVRNNQGLGSGLNLSKRRSGLDWAMSGIWINYWNKRNDIGNKDLGNFGCNMGTRIQGIFMPWLPLGKLGIPLKAEISDVIVDWAVNFLEEDRRIKARAPAAPGGRGLITPSWRPPDAGLFLVNTDAAIDVSRSKVGFGAIIHNCNKEVLAS